MPRDADAMSSALAGLPKHVQESKIHEKYAGPEFMRELKVFLAPDTPKDKQDASRKRLLQLRGPGARTYDLSDIADDVKVITTLHKGLDEDPEAGIGESRRYLYHHARTYIQRLKEDANSNSALEERRSRCGRCRYGLPCYLHPSSP